MDGGTRLGAARLFAALAAAGAAALAPVSALAVDKRVEKACKGDYKRLCPQNKAESTKLRACMEAKALEISSDCIQALVDSGEVDKKRVAKR